jgi:flagellar basal-body rod protein FlgB
VDVLTRSLNFLEARHRIISNNIANVNTPDFKAQDAPIGEFRAALERATERHRRNPAEPLKLAAAEHIRETRTGLEVTGIESKGTSILRHDGNNVDLEREMSDLAENTLLYRTLSELLRKQFAGLNAAIRERAD